MMNTARSATLPTFKLLAAGCALAVVAASCDNGGDEDSTGTATCSGIAAAAGTDQTVVLGNTVNLNGGDSTLCNGGSPSFTWTFQSVPTSSQISDQNLSDNSSPTAYGTSFTPDVAGDYVLSLVVTDRTFDAQSTPDVIVVSVTTGDLPPVADCGGDVTGAVGVIATLDGGGSYDPETQPLDYMWSLAGTPKCSALTSDDLASAGNSKASIVPDCNGFYTISLVVSDGYQYSAPSYCNVNVSGANQIPVADAGKGGEVAPCDGDLIHLNGYSSYDPEGAALTYKWSVLIVPKGSTSTNNNISDRAAAAPTFQWDVEGTYRFELSVYDGTQWSAPDIVEHTVNGTALNEAPIANAGEDMVVDIEGDCETSAYVWTCDDCEEAIATLDGTASADPNGDTMSYLWTEETGGMTIDTPKSAYTYARYPSQPSSYGVETQATFTVDLKVEDCLLQDHDTVQVTFTCTGTYM
jgi:hypothetical protein